MSYQYSGEKIPVPSVRHLGKLLDELVYKIGQSVLGESAEDRAERIRLALEIKWVAYQAAIVDEGLWDLTVHMKLPIRFLLCSIIAPAFSHPSNVRWLQTYEPSMLERITGLVKVLYGHVQAFMPSTAQSKNFVCPVEPILVYSTMVNESQTTWERFAVVSPPQKQAIDIFATDIRSCFSQQAISIKPSSCTQKEIDSLNGPMLFFKFLRKAVGLRNGLAKVLFNNENFSKIKHRKTFIEQGHILEMYFIGLERHFTMQGEPLFLDPNLGHYGLLEGQITGFLQDQDSNGLEETHRLNLDSNISQSGVRRRRQYSLSKDNETTRKAMGRRVARYVYRFS